MTALSRDRNTPSRSGDKRTPPVAANKNIYAGAMVAMNAAGNAEPMSTSTTLKGIGVAERQANNSSGAAGAMNVEVSTGIYRFANSASTDLITRADIGADCYGVDDQTVAKTNGSNTRSVAGKIFDVDDQGVWVKFS